MNAIVKSRPRLNIRNLATMGFAIGHSHYVYVARPDERTAVAHRLAECLADDYFADACDMMAQGDMIDIICHDGSAIVSVVECAVRPERVRVAVMARTGEMV